MIVGVNVGGTTTSIVSADESARIHERSEWPTKTQRGGEVFVEEIVAAIAGFSGRLEAVGISIGGPLDVRRGVLLDPPHLPGLAGFALAAAVRARIAVPLAIHHDAAACALAEWRWGSDAGAAGIAYLTCGTGFGCGLVLDGRVRYGGGGFSPEIGHVRYRDDGPSMFGKPGCYEGYGSAQAIALLARWRNPERFARSQPRDVVELAAAGDAEAGAAVATNAEAVGSACALLADLLALDAIVLGSLATYLGQPWIERVQATFAREALPHNVQRCAVRGPSIDAIQDRGALAAAFDALESPAGQVP